MLPHQRPKKLNVVCTLEVLAILHDLFIDRDFISP